MSEETPKIDWEYNTYGALEREVMFLGVPILPAGIVIVFFLLLALLGMSLTQSMKSLLLFTPAIAILVFMRQVTEKDTQALRIVGFELLCLFYRRNSKMFGGTHTLSALKYGVKNEDYKRLLEQDNQQSVGGVGFSTENIKTHYT